MKTICKISLVFLLLTGCATIADIKGILNPKLAGEIVLQFGSEQSLRLIPDTCTPGSRNYLDYFRGFDFTSSQKQWRVRAMTDQIQITSDGTNGQRVDIVKVADCSTLRLKADPTRWRVNHRPDYSVQLDLKCDTADGVRIEGHVEAKHCS